MNVEDESSNRALEAVKWSLSLAFAAAGIAGFITFRSGC